MTLKVGDLVRVSYEAVVRGIDSDEPAIDVTRPSHADSRWERTEHVTYIGPSIGERRRGTAWGTWIRTYAGWALIDVRRNYGDRVALSSANEEYHLMTDSAFAEMATEPVD